MNLTLDGTNKDHRNNSRALSYHTTGHKSPPSSKQSDASLHTSREAVVCMRLGSTYEKTFSKEILNNIDLDKVLKEIK